MRTEPPAAPAQMVSQFPPHTLRAQPPTEAGCEPVLSPLRHWWPLPISKKPGRKPEGQVSWDSDIDSDTRRCTRLRPHPPAHQPICLLSIQPVCPGCSVGQAVCQELERQPGASRALWSPSFMERSPHGEGRPGWKPGGGSPRVTTGRCDQLWWEEKATPQGRRPRKGLQGGQGGSESFPLNRRVPRRPTGQVKGAGGRL